MCTWVFVCVRMRVNEWLRVSWRGLGTRAFALQAVFSARETADAASQRVPSVRSISHWSVSWTCACPGNPTEVSAPDASAARQPRYVSGKARHKMAMREAAHLSQVSAHPAFLADPLGALQQHLSASLPAPPASEDDVGAGGGSTGDSGAAAGAGAGTGVGAGSSKAPKGSARAAADAAEAAAAAARKQRGRAGGARGRAAAKGKQRHGRAKFR